MRICRFDDDRLGIVDGEAVRDVSAALDRLPAVRWPVPPGDLLIAHLDELRAEMERLAAEAEPTTLAQVRLKSPVANPGKILAAPVNYRKHMEEAQADSAINYGRDIKTIADYGLFFKSPSSLVGPGEGVVAGPPVRRTDHEIELAVVIGRTGRNIPESDAMAHVAGYCIGLDMTIRGIEDRSYRKSLDSFSVLGPWLVTADEIADPGALDFALKVNGEVRQASSTRHLVWGVPKLIAYASAAYTLHPGDVIMTGTPEGVAPVKPGDVMDCWMEGIGGMEVAVRGRDHFGERS